MGVAHLDNHAGVLGEEHLHDVVALHVVQVDVQTAVLVGEAHLEQSGNHTAGADVVAGHNPAAAHQFLDGLEAVDKIVGVGHGGHVIAHLASRLREGGAAQSEPVETEVDVVERRVLVVHHHGRHHFLDVAHLAAAGHDDGARRDNLLAVGILLAQRERVLARGYIDAELAAEVAQGLDGGVEARVLTLLRTAGPHPVGRQRQTAHALGQGRPHDIGE